METIEHSIEPALLGEEGGKTSWVIRDLAEGACVLLAAGRAVEKQR